MFINHIINIIKLEINFVQRELRISISDYERHAYPTVNSDSERLHLFTYLFPSKLYSINYPLLVLKHLIMSDESKNMLLLK